MFISLSSSVQLLSHVRLFATPRTVACQASLSVANSWGLLTHVHWVSDAIQPSHPLSSPSPPALNLSQHQGLFKWVSSLHQVAEVSASASVLPMNIQDWFPLGCTGQISLGRAFTNCAWQRICEYICVCVSVQESVKRVNYNNYKMYKKSWGDVWLLELPHDFTYNVQFATKIQVTQSVIQT